MKNKVLKEFVVFEVLTATVASHTLLLSVNTPEFIQTMFYLMLLLMNLVCLLFIMFYYGEPEQDHEQLVDWDENLTQKALAWILIGVVGVYFVSVVIQNLVSSSIYIPEVVSLSVAGITFGELASIIIYNICLVSNSEEMTKMTAHLVIYLWLKDKFGEEKTEKYHDWIKGTAIVIPIGFWAVLHAYVAYVGKIMPILVISAFTGGLIIFGVLWQTRSLIAAILVHGLYNIVVLVAASVGLGLTVAQPIFLLPMTLMNVIMMVDLIWHRTHS